MGNRNVEKPYKLNEKHGFSKVKIACAKPLKTCLKLMIFEPKSKKGLQNNQKSIRFIDKTHMAFRHVEKPYKTCRKHRNFGGPNLRKSHNGTPLDSPFFILHSSFFIFPRMHWRHLEPPDWSPERTHNSGLRTGVWKLSSGLDSYSQLRTPYWSPELWGNSGLRTGIRSYA